MKPPVFRDQLWASGPWHRQRGSLGKMSLAVFAMGSTESVCFHGRTSDNDSPTTMMPPIALREGMQLFISRLRRPWAHHYFLSRPNSHANTLTIRPRRVL